MDTPSLKEDHISQIPALQLLINMGYEYLTPEEALELRGGKRGNVVLDRVLEKWIRDNNRIVFNGEEYPFSNNNINQAVNVIKNIPYDGLNRTNEQIYDLLSLGKSFEENIQGSIRSYTLKYIDWERIENNVYHVTEEFEVETSDGRGIRRPDIVLFVNGFPFVVIECKRPDVDDPINQAISQNIRNQKDNEIPKLFTYSQILMGISKNEAKYATATTPLKFWSIWRERENTDEVLNGLVNTPLSSSQKVQLFSDRFGYVKDYFDELETGGRKVTEQDRAIYSLLRKNRLMELSRKFIIFDKGYKKIARYQQYFAVKNTLDRVKTFESQKRRRGGIIWHTQGSGKSLTMVWLAKALALEPEIGNPRIIIVTDRIDLDKQIKDTFADCDMAPVKAKTGQHLLELIEQNKKTIITTVLDKFTSAINKRTLSIDDGDIFVLMDESHRSHYGSSHAMMRRVLTNACYIGFTGTPLMKKEKNTSEKFGGFIDKYTIDQAVNDKAVVPLLYEGRNIPQRVNKDSIDKWFEMISAPLTEEQKIDLKKKFSRMDKLNSSEQRINMVCYDISQHYKDNWKGTGFKAQLATPTKAVAIKYKKFLDDIGDICSEVVISSPDTREDNEDPLEEPTAEVQVFWKKMMDRFGNEERYNEELIQAFKHSEEPEMLIVVDKLLTGFDAPCNTILYLAKKLKEHNLLQAIARVNRIAEGKEFGYIIDYTGILKELNKALTSYSALESFDEEDVKGALSNIAEEIRKLPQRYSELWDVFKEISNKYDEEEYELLLFDPELRNQFYDKLSAFSTTLAIAVSSPNFYEETEKKKIDRYKYDVAFFQNLRTSIKKRYAETVDIREYEPKIQKLLDTYVVSDSVETITNLINIFDKKGFEKEIEKITGKTSKADTIAHRTLRAIQDKYEEDPIFYEKFSKLIEKTIKEYRDHRIEESQYFNIVNDIMNHVRDRRDDDEPESLKGKEIAKAFYGVTFDVLNGSKHKDKIVTPVKELATIIGIMIDDIIVRNLVVDWQKKDDIQKKMMNEIEDYLLDKEDLYIDYEEVDEILERVLHIARRRYAR